MDYLSANAIVALFPEMSYQMPYYGIVDLRVWLAAALVFVLLNLVFWALRRVVISRLKQLSRKTTTDVDDTAIEAAEGVRVWVYSIVSIFVALQFFELPNWADLTATGIFLFAIVWQLINIAGKFVTYFACRFLEKDEDGDGEVDPNAATASHMVTLMAKIVLWSLGGLFVLSNLGIEVTSLIAGLGIGGVAVAFALQGILSDLFASFSIYFDKPFRIGDYIVVGQDSGTVEKIGIKSTRLRTLQGEELVVSNAELTTARVQNFKKMSERRIVTQFGVTYETHQDQLKEIPGVVKRVFENIDNAWLERVHFTTFGDSALIYEVVYNVQSAEYEDYLDVQQVFNFDLLTRFAEMGVEFAYPTQTLRFDSSNVLHVRTEKQN